MAGSQPSRSEERKISSMPSQNDGMEAPSSDGTTRNSSTQD
jgi:hypothetical protein